MKLFYGRMIKAIIPTVTQVGRLKSAVWWVYLFGVVMRWCVSYIMFPHNTYTRVIL